MARDCTCFITPQNTNELNLKNDKDDDKVKSRVIYNDKVMIKSRVID